MSIHVLKATAAPTTAPTRTGVHYVDTLAKKHYFSVGTATVADWVEIGSGSGSGTSGGDAGINHILRGSADTGIDGWNLYKDAAGALPVDATQGGNLSSLTFTQNTTNPLRGTADFRLTKPASNVQGEGVSYDFTIARADLAKVQTISFDYEIISGTFATGDLTVYIIQDPSGTPAVIQPSAFRIESVGGTTKGRFIGVFQTHASVLNYRLAFHVASTSALAYTLGIDRISVGPQTVQYGAPVTDWQSYTPTYTGFGTVANSTASWRRVGNELQVQFYFESGTPTSTEARLSLPPGLTITGVGSAGNQPTEVGFYNTNGLSPGAGGLGAVNNLSYVTFNPTTAARTSANGNALAASGTGLSGKFGVPILGWSSTVQMSNDTETRVVAAKIYQSSAQSLSNNVITKATNLVVEFDTHAAWNSAQSRWYPPAPGFYQVSAATNVLTGGTGERVSVYVYKKGVVALTASATGNPNGSTSATVSGIVSLTTEDYLELGAALEGASRNTNPSALNFYLAPQRISGPSAIAASETVALAVGSNSGQVIPTGAETTILYNVIKKDSHGSYNAATGIWTCAIPGFYYFFSSGAFVPAASDTNSWTLAIQKNGVTVYYQTINKQTTAFAAIVALMTGGGEQLQAGDQIRVRASHDTGSGRGLSNNPATVHLTIFKVGNY